MGTQVNWIIACISAEKKEKCFQVLLAFSFWQPQELSLISVFLFQVNAV
uniref:Uncharacterized protein n=1 Tax=Anguilla anguilla TaxID=7936 RepID=A0A0E9PXE6_ANGAN